MSESSHVTSISSVGGGMCYSCGILFDLGGTFKTCPACQSEKIGKIKHVSESTRVVEKPISKKEPIIEKPCHVGAPKIYALELECQILCKAFDSYGCYLVGSSIHRADWRDVDVRMIMADKDFFTLFPDAHDNGSWEFDPRWLYMTIAISERLSKQTGLPVDFQFQPITHANKWHKGQRHGLGMSIPKSERPEHQQDKGDI